MDKFSQKNKFRLHNRITGAFRQGNSYVKDAFVIRNLLHMGQLSIEAKKGTLLFMMN